MPGNLLIRSLSQNDPELISAAFAAQGWDKPFELYRRYFQEQTDGTRAVFIAEYDGDFAGYVTLVWLSGYPAFRQRNIPEIADLNVLKRYQRRRVASALLDAAEKRAAECSPVVGLGVGLTGDYGPAQRLYVRRGYVPDGSGAWSHDKMLQYGECVPVDHDLVLYLTRPLTPESPRPYQIIETTVKE